MSGVAEAFVSTPMAASTSAHGAAMFATDEACIFHRVVKNTLVNGPRMKSMAGENTCLRMAMFLTGHLCTMSRTGHRVSTALRRQVMSILGHGNRTFSMDIMGSTRGRVAPCIKDRFMKVIFKAEVFSCTQVEIATREPLSDPDLTVTGAFDGSTGMSTTERLKMAICMAMGA